MSESDTMFNERDRRCAAVQLMLSTDPTYDNRTIASTRNKQTRMVQRLRAQFTASDAHLEVVDGAEGHRQVDPDQGVHRKGPGNPWWNSPAAYSTDCQRFRRLTRNCECMCEGGLEVKVLQAPNKPDLDWEDKEPQANQVRQASLLPQPELTGLFRLVIRREHDQHDMLHHQSHPDRRHPPHIRRAPTGACGKGMVPVPDPYQGGDWDWRWLHWICISSTT